MLDSYDIIVVGGGHAGCEAAAAAANMGSKTLLITMNLQTIAQMSCNPAMGGVAKGQIIREIDALGGLSGMITDKTMIQFRMLNLSKGPAMWSPRAQSDRMEFSKEWRLALEQIPNLDFWQDTVKEIIFENNHVCGVKTSMGIEIKSKAVVLTNGTFLNGIIHIGSKQFGGGRMGDPAATGITEQLIKIGFESGRMKTGTPPRVDGRSLDYSKMERQDGDPTLGRFSYKDFSLPERQRPCWITYTNQNVHDILKTGFDESPMYTGRIQGLGPRYCPSIEDKINRFAERERHQIFVEPEGWDTIEIYVNGFSTSLPEEVQLKALREIPGFEKAKIFRPGYAIEYDFFPPTQLKLSLETKLIENLYFAGQINGTTGYEEAASQGLMAGINAHLKINEKEAFTLSRSEAYIGVLIDDLVNKGTEEPYRMFTSRAEYRILLRQDNADIRLTPKAHEIGLADDDRLKRVEYKREKSAEIINYLKKTSISPEEANPVLNEMNTPDIPQNYKLAQLLLRPMMHLEEISKMGNVSEYLSQFDNETQLQAEILLKYESYIEKEKDLAIKLEKLDSLRIYKDIDYRDLKSLSMEAREKLTKLKPETLGQASRISGVSPADVSILLMHLNR